MNSKEAGAATVYIDITFLTLHYIYANKALARQSSDFFFVFSDFLFLFFTPIDTTNKVFFNKMKIKCLNSYGFTTCAENVGPRGPYKEDCSSYYEYQGLLGLDFLFLFF